MSENSFNSKFESLSEKKLHSEPSEGLLNEEELSEVVGGYSGPASMWGHGQKNAKSQTRKEKEKL